MSASLSSEVKALLKDVKAKLQERGGALDVRRPRLVRDLPSVATVACGESHTLVLDLSAQLHACGQGRFGALGLESLDNRASPTLRGPSLEPLPRPDSVASCGRSCGR